MRNHDELTLDKLSDSEREEVFAAFGPDPELQLYGRGLRRRLPTMLGGNAELIRLVYSLMFSLPGTPVLFYGEEIGMAENLEIDGRYSVRAPMQWSGEPAGGFTTADEPVRPLVETGPFGFPRTNVERQRRDPGSLLNWMERLIRRRRECPELGCGDWALLEQEDRAVFAHRADWDGSTIVAVHNLAGRGERGDAAPRRRGRAGRPVRRREPAPRRRAHARPRALRPPLVPAAPARAAGRAVSVSRGAWRSTRRAPRCRPAAAGSPA